MKREIARRASTIVAVIAGSAGCVAHPAVAPMPGIQARFVAASGSSEAAARAPSSMSAADSTPCRLAVHFDGIARVGGNQLDVALAHAWVAVTRNNDKRWDDLHLRIEARGVDASRTIVLAPTVDSAGPQLTTWQADDTTRLFLPLAAGERPRRLFFFVSYHTLGYAGQFAGCDGMASSGPLAFDAPAAER